MSKLHDLFLAGHIIGFMVWIGTIFSLLEILTAHGEQGAGANATFAKLEKRSCIALDIGSMAAIVFGLLRLFVPPDGILLFKSGGFFHAKLLLVFGIIVIHVIVRRKVRIFQSGNVTPLPSWLVPLSFLSVIGIVTMMIVRPF